MADRLRIATTCLGQCLGINSHRALAIADEDVHFVYFHQIGTTGIAGPLPSFPDVSGRHATRNEDVIFYGLPRSYGEAAAVCPVLCADVNTRTLHI